MRRRTSSLAALSVAALSLASVSGVATAQPAGEKKAEPAKAEPAKKEPAKQAAKSDAPAAAGKKTDPEGKKGVSPYTDAITKGDAALVARDLPGAIDAYQAAVKLDAAKALAFYRLAEAFRESGKLDDAEQALTTAAGKRGDERLLAKVQFQVADLRERQKRFDGVKEQWDKYATLAGEPKAQAYPATAKARLEALATRDKLEKDYAAVKERVKKRQEEREKEARDNAMKDKKNK